ncbi:MAG: alpha/beta fold hydrolase [Pseudomonadota bacterium]
MLDSTLEDRNFPSGDPRQLLREGSLVLTELAALMVTAPFLAGAPRGDGHPILVLPGLMASDQSTEILRGFLTSRGYQSTPWGLGRNMGPTMSNLAARLGAKFEEAYSKNNHQKISLVGWSLGGVYARLLAHFYPDKVRNVITLGSPYRSSSHSASEHTQRQGSAGGPTEGYSIHDLRQLAGVAVDNIPTTSIFSRQDIVVPWQIATEPTGPFTENIEVSGSHFGFGFSPAVLFAIADRLAIAEGKWRPFRRKGWKRFVYGSANLEPKAKTRGSANG